LEAAGSEVKTPESIEEGFDLDVVEPNWMDKPLWEKKFRTWQALTEKSCPAKAGPGGRYCSWVGQGCFYNGCPRRIFEEVAVVSEAIKRPTPSPDYVAELKTLKNQLLKTNRQLKKSQERIKDLEEEIEILRKKN